MITAFFFDKEPAPVQAPPQDKPTEWLEYHVVEEEDGERTLLAKITFMPFLTSFSTQIEIRHEDGKINTFCALHERLDFLPSNQLAERALGYFFKCRRDKLLQEEKTTKKKETELDAYLKDYLFRGGR